MLEPKSFDGQDYAFYSALFGFMGGISFAYVTLLLEGHRNIVSMPMVTAVLLTGLLSISLVVCTYMVKKA